MSAETLGRAVSEATKFLLQVHEDVRCQIRSLDRVMSDRGWRPAEPNKVGYTLGNSLNDGRQWVIDSVSRCYVPTDEQTASDRVIAVLWFLYADPGDAYEVPTVAAVAARLDSPQPFQGLLAADWGVGAIYRAAGRQPLPVPLAPAQLAPLLPRAVTGMGVVLPLCELTNEAVLEGRLVGPITEAEGRLGTPAP